MTHQLTLFVPDAESEPWQITCEACGAEIPHQSFPDIHVFRVRGLTEMVEDQGNVEAISARLDALASALPTRALVIDANDIEHQPPSLIERAIKKHLATCAHDRTSSVRAEPLTDAYQDLGGEA